MGLILNDHNISLNGAKNLTELNLENNGIVFGSKKQLTIDSKKLSKLRIGYNRFSVNFSELPIVHGSPNLRELDVQYSGIRHLSPTVLSNLPNLRKLNFAGNEISSFRVDLSGSKLEFLNLSNNNLRELTPQVRNQLDSWAKSGRQVLLDLSGNPLKCLCENLDFLVWLVSPGVTLARKDLTKCDHLQDGNVLVTDMNNADPTWRCRNVDAILAGVGSGLSVILLVAVAIGFHKKRWTIRYWLHISKELLRNKKQARHTTVYQYDAFIAYTTHGNERTWVHTTLRSKLEEEYGLRLCIHYRDFPLARDIDDSIVNGINNSNKVVLILSPTFLRSGWCDFEYRMAKERQVRERRDCLVLVIYEKIHRSLSTLPRSLVRLLDKKIYAEWTEDRDGQELFWRRLVKSIRDNVRYETNTETAIEVNVD